MGLAMSDLLATSDHLLTCTPLEFPLSMLASRLVPAITQHMRVLSLRAHSSRHYQLKQADVEHAETHSIIAQGLAGSCCFTTQRASSMAASMSPTLPAGLSTLV